MEDHLSLIGSQTIYEDDDDNDDDDDDDDGDATVDDSVDDDDDDDDEWMNAGSVRRYPYCKAWISQG